MHLLGLDELEQRRYGAIHTSKEIAQQPDVWKETFEILRRDREEIISFIKEVKDKYKQIRIILTGAGTSAFVGETIMPYLKQTLNKQNIILESIPTTDIVSNPHYYLDDASPTIMISFARSGNSPESLAAIHLAEQIIKHFYGIILTCNKDGLLALGKRNDKKHRVITMPQEANDQAFAMTSSFTSMLLSTLVLFHTEPIQEVEKILDDVIYSSHQILKNDVNRIKELAKSDFSKVVYLGSGIFQGLARESALKLLELTSGKVSVSYETSLGFRHGPKSILDKETMIFIYLSCHPYTKQYDLDILKELYYEQNRGRIIVISSQHDEVAKKHCDLFFNINLQNAKEDLYLTFPYILYAQSFAMLRSIHLGISPDNPSPLGVVNRVVEGVSIYPFVDKSKEGGVVK